MNFNFNPCILDKNPICMFSNEGHRTMRGCSGPLPQKPASRKDVPECRPGDDKQSDACACFSDGCNSKNAVSQIDKLAKAILFFTVIMV